MPHIDVSALLESIDSDDLVAELASRQGDVNALAETTIDLHDNTIRVNGQAVADIRCDAPTSETDRFRDVLHAMKRLTP